MSTGERVQRTQDLIDAIIEEKADDWAAGLGCTPEEVRACAPRAAEPEPRYMSGREFLVAVGEMRAASPTGSIFEMDIDDIIADIEGRS